MSFNNSDIENHNFENKNNDENDFYHSVLVGCIVAMTFTSYEENNLIEFFFTQDTSFLCMFWMIIKLDILSNLERKTYMH